MKKGMYILAVPMGLCGFLIDSGKDTFGSYYKTLID
jgi:hypothetical protein